MRAPVQEPGTPAIDLGGGGSFQPRGAWDDLSGALQSAQQLIYIVGWSVFTDITLVRDPGKPMHPSEAPTLGAHAGVTYDKSPSVLTFMCPGCIASHMVPLPFLTSWYCKPQ